MRGALLLAAAALLAGCAGTGEYFRGAAAPAAAAPRALGDLAWREYWTGVVFNGEKIGFTRLRLRALPEAPGRYEIESEAAIRLHFLGTDKEVNLHALDRVRADLTLESFRYDYEQDGSKLHLEGRVEGGEAGGAGGGALAYSVTAQGSRSEETLALAGPVYPESALALRPVLRGLAVGRHDRYTVFDGETRSLETVEQSVLAYETSTLFEGPAYKVSTSLLGLQTDTWIAPDGRPVFELSLHGTMISALEDEASARRYLVSASLNKSDALLDFSRLRSPEIDGARRLARIEIVLDGVPADIAAPGADGQRCTREGERLDCIVDRRKAPGDRHAAPAGPPAAPPGGARRYLAPSLAAPSVDPEIVRVAREIGTPALPAGERIRRILDWISAHIDKQAIDTYTAVDVLHERRAECQGHAYLFAALARALGLPAKIVNGIVYSEDYGGFLYHTWNEVWIDGEGWRAVDATFGQPRADATHLVLLEGESARDLTPLVGMIGRARVVSVGGYAYW